MPEDLTREGATIDGRYRLLELIGQGGTGEVWRAEHLTLKSPVAIKLLRSGSAVSERSRKRFLTEARLTANLNTRHAVRVFDFGVIDTGVPYLVMELLEGETLRQRIDRQGRLSIRETVTLLAQAGRAIDRAHGLGIVHRDLKPENIIIVPTEDDGDEVKVVDFGIAKLRGDLETRLPDATSADTLSLRISRTGALLGTPWYMAPEQVRASPDVGPTADIWALGIVAYQCLTGGVPFNASDVLGVLQLILAYDYVPIHFIQKDIPAEFDDWFRKAAAPEPEDRFQSPRAAIVGLATVLGVPELVMHPFDGGTNPGREPVLRAPGSTPTDTLVLEFVEPVTSDIVHAQRLFSIADLLAGGLVVIAVGAALFYLW